MTDYVVEVNEVAIWARGTNVIWWWNEWRHRMEALGRIIVVTPSVAGDRVEVTCADKEEAQWVAEHMHNFVGIPPSAAKVKAKRARNCICPPNPDAAWAACPAHLRGA